MEEIVQCKLNVSGFPFLQFIHCPDDLIRLRGETDRRMMENAVMDSGPLTTASTQRAWNIPARCLQSV